ncbi:MAG: DUF4468 domain-containing protein [Cytophagaceae bacterium]
MRLFKHVVSLGLLLIGSISIQAQSSFPIDSETQKIAWVETVTIDSLTKQQLYERAKRWMTIYYKSTTFDTDSKESFTVTKTGDFTIALTYDFKYKSQNNISYTITINQKDGKYRYKITDVKFYNVASGPKTQLPLEAAYAKMTTQNKNETTSQVLKEMNAVIADLKNFMLKGDVPTTEEDW